VNGSGIAHATPAATSESSMSFTTSANIPSVEIGLKPKCLACIWGCKMPVEMIIDQWNPSKRRYRTETFCYGPKSCHFYKAGPTRKVPGRKGMTWEEEDWVDEDATSHRGDHD
jgi:hypothetical protein